MSSVIERIGKWFHKTEPSSSAQCVLCGLIPGRQYMIPTDEPILHPHKCSRCQSVVFVPGPMMLCEVCLETCPSEPPETGLLNRRA